MADALTTMLDDLITAGAFDDLHHDSALVPISYSRVGGAVDPGLTEVVLAQLRERGLAGRSVDGVSVPLHRSIRSLVVLMALPQLLRAPAEAAGFALQPVSPHPAALRALEGVLRLDTMPTAGAVVSADLEQVAVDLSTVPLDEVLDFRRQHGPEYRAYARELRTFIRAAGTLDEHGRAEALADRQQAIRDAAADLGRRSKTSWPTLGNFGLGIAGAAVSVAVGAPAGAAFAGAQALLGLHRAADPRNAYSYLFRVQRDLDTSART